MNPAFNAPRGVIRALSLVLLLAAAGCDDEPDRRGPVVPAEPYDAAGLVSMRAEKNAAFRTAESPLPEAMRSSFGGLAYFDPAPALAFRISLERFENPETVKVSATGGDVRMMTRYGRFRFEIDGTACSLTVFKSNPTSAHLFVPFTDLTNGTESYEVGRYLDLEEHGVEEPYLLDFNLSYNPYCAYDTTYTCPIVPRENTLSVAVRAGEKAPPFGAKE